MPDRAPAIRRITLPRKNLYNNKPAPAITSSTWQFSGEDGQLLGHQDDSAGYVPAKPQYPSRPHLRPFPRNTGNMAVREYTNSSQPSALGLHHADLEHLPSQSPPRETSSQTSRNVLGRPRTSPDVRLLSGLLRAAPLALPCRIFSGCDLTQSPNELSPR